MVFVEKLAEPVAVGDGFRIHVRSGVIGEIPGENAVVVLGLGDERVEIEILFVGRNRQGENLEPMLVGEREKTLVLVHRIGAGAVDEIEARGFEIAERAVDAVAVRLAFAHRVDADGEERLAAHEHHAVVAQRDTVLGGDRPDRAHDRVRNGEYVVAREIRRIRPEQEPGLHRALRHLAAHGRYAPFVVRQVVAEAERNRNSAPLGVKPHYAGNITAVIAVCEAHLLHRAACAHGDGNFIARLNGERLSGDFPGRPLLIGQPGDDESILAFVPSGLDLDGIVHVLHRPSFQPRLEACDEILRSRRKNRNRNHCRQKLFHTDLSLLSVA